MHVKAFICHASEDKERFVLPFAVRLRASGIDAWVDRWELLPGDPLVAKIFDEGIGKADAMVIVLSEFSVDKPWVRKELNVAVVRNLAGKLRIVPVVLDDCAVPTPLQDTLWQRIQDLEHFDSEYDLILRSLRGQHNKPPLGKPAAYLLIQSPVVHGLSAEDSVTIRLAVNAGLRKNGEIVQASDMRAEVDAAEMSEAQLRESLVVLAEGQFIKLLSDLGPWGFSFQLLHRGFDAYFTTHSEDYPQRHRAICLSILNQGLRDAKAIAESTGYPRLLVDHVLRDLTRKGLIDGVGVMQRGMTIGKISPRLRRALE